ncbi:MAG: carboxypeptidase regulatory-like domain-containing protein, partial [Gaiellaceae bacterium]
MAVTAAEVQVLSPGTESVVASASTDGSGFYQLSIATGTYDVKVVPPADSGFQPTLVLNRDIAADTTLNFVLVPTGMATLHGRVLDRDGNGVPGQTVSLSPSGGSVTTDALGGYAFEVAPGTYQVTVRGIGNGAALNVPQNYQLQTHSPALSLTQDTVLDLPLPVHRVDVHVQDAAGNPVAGVDIAASILGGSFCCSNITVAGFTFETAWSYYGSPMTDASGDALLWLFRGPSGGSFPYNFTASPPAGSLFKPTTVAATVTGDTLVTITLTESVTLSGRVLDRDGNGVPGQTVSLSPSGGSVTTDALGGYAFEVAPGT